jgi:exopolysaccharide biosynthesis WecB/TagA/CpsF family protein
MIDLGKKNVLGVLVDAVDYEAAVGRIIRAASERRGMSVSALAVHGVMTGVLDTPHRYRLNSFDLITPDGQPVRWALNWLYRAGLRDRVYGPELTLRVCAEAARRSLPIYLYGSKQTVLDSLVERLAERFPGIRIAGAEPSKYRRLSKDEKHQVVARIRASGAALTLVGLGCPRQEVWAYEFRDALDMPVLAVGAAFDFCAGTLPQAPPALQRAGLEWAFRLYREPRRLWRRYLYLNPTYVAMLMLQKAGLRRFNPSDTSPPAGELLYG